MHRSLIFVLAALGLIGCQLYAQEPSPTSVMYGVDVVVRDHVADLQGKGVAVVCNHTTRTYDGTHLLDALTEAGVEIKTIFAPEHGIRGTEHTHGETTIDEGTGATIYSLYDSTKAPLSSELEGVDVLLLDLPDIGCRFYTYISTMGRVIEACAENDVEVWILDRPNPISGRFPEGAIADDSVLRGFTSFYPIPVRHALTIGEIAMMAIGEDWYTLPEGGVDIEVIEAEGWTRAMYGDSIDREFIRPSPNISGVESALTYPGIGLFESTTISAGRGTMIPFLVMGAPWIDSKEFCAALNEEALPGVEFMPIQWTPEPNAGCPEQYLKFAYQECGGVTITVTDRELFRPVMTGLAMAWHLFRMYPDDAQIRGETDVRIVQMFGDPEVGVAFRALNAGEPAASWREIYDSWQPGVDAYWAAAQQYLLYQ